VVQKTERKNKMVSEKQLLANQQNALCSTGPRTAAGKAVASQNAIRHGLRAAHTVVPGEDAEEFDSFRHLMLDDLAPAGALEVMLTDRIVAAFWKLHRAGRIETELLNEMDTSPQDPDTSKNNGETPFNVAFTKTYACPVHERNLEQKALPDSCESCSLTPEPNLSEPQAVAPIVTTEDSSGPAQGEEKTDLPVADKQRETKPQSPLALGRLFKSDMAGGNILARFRLYEGQIERSLYKALTEFQKLQILRSNRWISASDPSADQTQSPALES